MWGYSGEGGDAVLVRWGPRTTGSSQNPPDPERGLGAQQHPPLGFACLATEVAPLPIPRDFPIPTIHLALSRIISPSEPHSGGVRPSGQGRNVGKQQCQPPLAELFPSFDSSFLLSSARWVGPQAQLCWPLGMRWWRRHRAGPSKLSIWQGTDTETFGHTWWMINVQIGKSLNAKGALRRDTWLRWLDCLKRFIDFHQLKRKGKSILGERTMCETEWLKRNLSSVRQEGWLREVLAGNESR